MILTLSVDAPDSLHVIFAVGTNEMKFLGQTIPVMIRVHQLHAGRVQTFPFNGVEETNPLSPLSETVAPIHGEFPVLI